MNAEHTSRLGAFCQPKSTDIGGALLMGTHSIFLERNKKTYYVDTSSYLELCKIDVYSTDRSNAVVPVLVLLFVAL